MKEKYYTVAKTITQWKFDNRLENYLGYKADTSEFWKWLYVKYYQLFDSQYFRGGAKLVNKELEKQKAKQSELIEQIGVKKLRRDMIYSLHRFGASFNEYFMYKFYDLNHLGRSRFNNFKIQYGYCEIVNDPSIRDLFDDKGVCFKLLSKYYKRDVLVVYGEKEFDALSDFLESHKSFIYKPFKGAQGVGIKIYKDFAETAQDFFSKAIANGPFVVEELIQQHSSLANLHPNSINTVRLVTFRIENEVHIIGAALRMGSGGSSVDNAGSGGMFASIDTECGCVNSMAYDRLSNAYTIHPDTKLKIVGFDIPEWKSLICLAKEIATIVDGATMISWDLAYSKEGWIVVEGNDVGGPHLLQSPLQIGIKDKIVKLIDRYIERKNISSNK